MFNVMNKIKLQEFFSNLENAIATLKNTPKLLNYLDDYLDDCSMTSETVDKLQSDVVALTTFLL